MAEIKHTSTIPSKSTKRVKRVKEEFIYGFKDCPIPKAVIDKWIEDLRLYTLEKPEQKTMTKFLHTRGYSEKRFYEKMKEYPELKEQYEQTKLEIGERLWSDCVDGKKNWMAAKFLIQEYGEHFARAKEAEKPQQQTGVIERFVVLPQIPVPQED